MPFGLHSTALYFRTALHRTQGLQLTEMHQTAPNCIEPDKNTCNWFVQILAIIKIGLWDEPLKYAGEIKY